MKSDDVIGRVQTYEAIIKGKNIPEPGIPESFKVLIKELQALGLDVRLLNEDNTEVKLVETSDYNDAVDLRSVIEGDRRFRNNDEDRELQARGMHSSTGLGDSYDDTAESAGSSDDYID